MRWGITFRRAMVLVFLLAVAVRWIVFLRWYRDVPLVETDTINDNLYYHLSANLLADGHGFANPFEFFVNGTIEPTAAHPPGFTVYLSIWSFFGLDTVSWHRIASGLLSATVVFPVGILLRRLFDPRVAVIGMVGVALYPPLWANDALILSESMYIPIAGWALVFAHRVWDDPSMRRIVELTVVLSLGALTRSEPFLWFFLLLTPLLMFHPRLTWRERFRKTATAAVLAMVILAPWVGRNVTIFDEPTYLAVGPGYVLELGNCDATYSGRFLGYWSAECDDGTTWPEGADESGIAAAKYAKAREYIGDHVDEVPKVVAARVGRILGFYRPLQGIDFDVFFERRIRSHTEVGLVLHYVLMAASVYGAVVWHRRTTLIPLLAVAGTSILTAAITFGIGRYRVGADLVFVILAAVALGALLDRYGPRVPEPEPEDALRVSIFRHRAVRWIVAIGVAGWVLRAWTILFYRPTCAQATPHCYQVAGDAEYHHLQANLLAEGHGYINPLLELSGIIEPSAGDPPLYAAYLAAWSKVGFDGVTDHRMASTLWGFVLIVALGLFVRRLAGDVAGVVAAALAAVHPLMWINDMMLLSEGMYQPFVVLILWAAYEWIREPSRRNMIVLGVTIALATLIRAEALALYGFMVLPLVWWARELDRREQFRQVVLCGVAGLIVMSPWLIYNNLRFEEPVTFSAVPGTVMMAGACDSTWSGEFLGFWRDCFDERGLYDELERELPGASLSGDDFVVYDESVRDAFNQEKAIEYYLDNWPEYPKVALARIGRSLEFFRVGHTLRMNYNLEGRWEEPSVVGLGLYYALIPFTLLGGIVMRRRGLRLTPMIAMWLAIAFASATTFGLTRYRVPIDIAMMAMSAIAISWIFHRLRAESRLPAAAP